MHVYHVIILSLAEPGPVKIVMSCEAPGLFATTAANGNANGDIQHGLGLNITSGKKHYKFII